MSTAVALGWRRPNWPKTSMEAGGLAVRAGYEQVGDLAGQAAVAAADLAVADDGAAQALTEVDVGEVVQRAGPRDVVVALGAGGPVHVVVHDDGAGHQRGEHRDRIQVAEQERAVRQVDHPAGGPVHRIGRADHGQPDRPAGHRPGGPAGPARAPPRGSRGSRWSQ